MSYLVQKTRVAQLLIGGVDYTSSLIEWSVSDSGAYKQGLITTSGTLVLGQRPGQSDIQDYDRNLFKRGTVVTLDVSEPGSSSYRHPRGYLYVVGTSYQVEAERLVVDIACKLSLAFLTDNVDEILPLIPIPLDPAQRRVENCSASFASAGMVLYQDNQGALQSRKFFGTDSTAGIEPGEWTSILGTTALSVSPLANSGAIPDKINLSYQVPSGLLAGDNTGKVDTVTEVSNYFLNYPATVWVRVPDPTPSGERAIPEETTPSPPSPPSPPSACGTIPTPPDGGGGPSTEQYYLCSDLWTTGRETVYVPAVRTTVSTTTYGAPGGQASYALQTIYGPALEANASYFADYYAFCQNTYGYDCNPGGNCPYYGLEAALLGYTETFYEYGEANELVRTIVDTYQMRLSAANADDYRAGQRNGFPVNFDTSLASDVTMYRVSRVVTETFQEDNVNVALTTAYTSMTSRGVGIKSGASLDALNGIITTTRRESVTTTTLDIRPDSVNPPSTSTDQKSTEILLVNDGYITPPNEAADYVFEDSIPTPFLSEDENEINGWLNDYVEYAKRFVQGDLYGLQIAESLRSGIVDGWYPGMPFYYADLANNTISAMRMDACTWGATPEEALVVTNGIWLGFVNGTLSLGNNLVGNSRPDLDGNSPNPPSPPDDDPDVNDPEPRNDLRFRVDLNTALEVSVTQQGPFEPNPTDFDALQELALVPYMLGFTVATGGLLETDGTGGIPVEYNGSLVTENATVLNGDLFAEAT